MPTVLRSISRATVVFLILSPSSVWAQEPSGASLTACKGKDCVTINEPATVRIEELVKQADLVAAIKTLSGDTEHYQSTVYKAEVIQAFKGTSVGAKIFFGPFVGLKLGWNYLAFLRVSEKEVVAKEPTGLNYGRLDLLYRIMYEGYSIMPVEYACVFDGKEINEQCDYGIKINTYQVVLPQSIRVFPLEPDDAEGEGKKWVRRKALISFLEQLSGSK